MTKARTIVAAVLALAVTGGALAQESSFEYTSDNYRVVSEVSQDHAQAMADRLEANLALYNQIFRFPLDELAVPMRVRVFGAKPRFDSYLRRLVDETRQGYVYLHYADLAKSELVGYALEDGTLDQSLIHQSFIQFFRAFIPNPPLWLREGFAVYFEASRYDPEFGTAVYRENLAWLDTLKGMVDGSGEEQAIALDEMLALDLDGARERINAFYPQAWGMVSFLVNVPAQEINRILWDSLSALEADATLDENVAAVHNEAFRWVSEEQLTETFLAYLSERRSFRGWVEHGVDQYEADNFSEAERAFVQAINLREDNYVPYYYLGLINYERGSYELADFYYQEALSRGAEQAITLYALGVNAYANNRFDEAVTYLEQTVSADPAYRDRAENLLIRIEG